MSNMIGTFKELREEQRPMAGGKGGALARLYQAGFPVPDGFVILPAAFAGDELTPVAWTEAQAQLARMRDGDGRTAFAVRSSALSEDSALASFAGEFETVLDVHTDDMILNAIHAVRRSRKSERVKAYSQAKGMDFAHEVAVVVQRLVRADISGILFTADPVTGSHMAMSGNFIYGLGEELVSGEADPYPFTLSRPKGRYEGPTELKRFSRKLFKMGLRLEKELGCPQDIEWAIVDRKLFLLQSRPITTLVSYDPVNGMWNDSHTGDYLWVGHEVLPDVLTPSSYSMWQSFHGSAKIADILGMGNIGGRIYLNYSLAFSLMTTFGKSKEEAIEYVKLTAGALPEGMEISPVPLSKWSLITAMLPIMWKLLPRQLKLKRKAEQTIASVPGFCQETRARIRRSGTQAELISLWRESIFPLFDDMLLIQDALNEDYFNPYVALRKRLTGLMGQARAHEFLAKVVGGTGELESMASLIGLARLANGEISRAEYSQLAGHRPPKENELIEPRLYEDPNWIDEHLGAFERNPVDVTAMLEKRAREFDAEWRAFESEFPKQARRIRRAIDQITGAIDKRERLRSELTRVIGIIRAWYLKASELLGLNDGIFFLTIEEVLQVLSGDEAALSYIPTRRDTYEKLFALPAYPLFINGRFDPFRWAADPDRRGDVFDSHAPVTVADTGTITGYPGSAGRVEGVIRHLTGPEQGHRLHQGEILLASTTNVGWTPVFPRAAAVITDIGAPLSHAAIVARELGIPAVVGCGNATMRLKTGDRVIVDGGRGTVEIVNHT